MKYLSGLIILLAYSLVMANGERGKETYPEIRTTELSTEENKAIDDSYLKTVVDVTLSIVQRGSNAKREHYSFLQFVRSPRKWNKFGTHPLLEKIFPTVTFYRVYSSATRPAFPYLYAEANGKFYYMPQSFNRLLLDNGLKVTYKDITELAKAFVIIALEGHEITFQNVKKSKRIINKDIIYWVHLNIQVNDQKQIYGCRFEKGQMQWATMNIEGETTTKYFDFEIIENPPNKKN